MYKRNGCFCLKGILVAAFWFAGFISQAQTVHLKAAEPRAYDSVMVWLKDLYDQGVTVSQDSVFVSKESVLLLNDPAYRKLLYPEVYTWEATISLIQKQDIKKALWYMINLYGMNDQNKELVVKSVLIYDKLFKMDKVMVSTFYTYCLTDPEVGKIENGHTEVTAPHIMEQKLNSLREILFYLDKYRPADRKESVKNNVESDSGGTVKH